MYGTTYEEDWQFLFCFHPEKLHSVYRAKPSAMAGQSTVDEIPINSALQERTRDIPGNGRTAMITQVFCNELIRPKWPEKICRSHMTAAPKIPSRSRCTASHLPHGTIGFNICEWM